MKERERVEITVEKGTVLLWVKPVSPLLILADTAKFIFRQDGRDVLEVPATWHRPDEGWFTRILLEEFAPGDYQVVLEAADCSDQPKGVLTVSH